MTKPYGRISTLRSWALLPLAALALAACGGGESDPPLPGPILGPVTVLVAVPPQTAATPGDSAGAIHADQTGSLNYMVFGASDVATGTPVLARASISRIGITHAIEFPNTGAFAPAGLVISKNIAAAAVETWNGISYNGGILNSADSFVGIESGLLSDGNFLVYCSARMSYVPASDVHPVTDPVARAGAQVAISGNFVAMANIAPLYGKTFKRFDCTNSAPDTKFGDGKGNFTMAFNGMTLNQAQVEQAFSAMGYQPSPGLNPTYKRRAYQITIRGVTRYVILALDTDAVGTPTASVLYQFF